MGSDFALVGEPNIPTRWSSGENNYAADPVRISVKRKINEDGPIFFCEMNLEQAAEDRSVTDGDNEALGTHRAERWQSGPRIGDNRGNQTIFALSHALIIA